MKEKLAILLVAICCIIPYQVFASDKNDPATKTANSSSHDNRGIFSHDDKSNLISNSGFEKFTSGWMLGKYNGGSGFFTTDSINAISGKQSGVVLTENQKQDLSDVQLFSFLEISKNTLYAFSFKASVQKTCLISISVSNGVEIFYEEKLLLQPEKKDYGPYIFQSEIDEPFSFFAFNLGKTNREIRLDEVVIQTDITEFDINKKITDTGINLGQKKALKTLHINLPKASEGEYPLVVMDEKGNTIAIDNIGKGEQKIHFTLNSDFEEGQYVLKIFTPSRTLAYNFEIEY